MKKSFLLIAVLLLTLIFVSAQTNVSQTSPNPDNIINSANQFIEKDISVPEPLQIFAKIFFGFEEKISLQMLIIILALWVLFFVAFSDIIATSSSFSNPVSWIIGLCMTVMLGALGVIRSLSIFLLNQALSIRFLEKWPAGALTLVFVVIILILGITSRLFRGLKEHRIIEKAREKGIKRGARLATIEWMSRTWENITDSLRPTRRT